MTPTSNNDPWNPTAATPLPNHFLDTDGTTVTVTTPMDSSAQQIDGYVQITLGQTELRLDPNEAERFGNYVLQAASKLHGRALDSLIDTDNVPDYPPTL